MLSVLRHSNIAFRPICRVYTTPSTSTAVKAESASKTDSKKAVTEKSPASSATPLSSCAAGTVLTGVNYLKGQTPLVALPDEEYPSWLWTVLQPKVYEDDGPGGKLERVTRRRARQQAIKERNFMQTQ